MKRLIKKSEKIYIKDIADPDDVQCYGENTDYGVRDFAICYIDGGIYSGDVHKDILIEQIDNNAEVVDTSGGFVTEEEQEDFNLPMAFASYLKGTNGKDYIAIYPGTLFDVSMDEFVNALKKEYSNAIICLDNNDREFCEDDAYIETI